MMRLLRQVNYRNLLAIFVFTMPFLSWSHEFSKCSQALKGRIHEPLKRTLGLEWEFSPVNSPVDHAKPSFAHKAKEAYLESQVLANSSFRQLFGLYGKNSRGEFIYGLIPDEITKQIEFQILKFVNGLEFETTENQTLLKNWETIPRQSLMVLIQTLFEIRGQHSDILKLKKIPSAWTTYNNPYDQMIPDEVSEEWRNGVNFVGIEFPMSGFTHKATHLYEYLENLWLRLGLFSPKNSALKKALQESIGHIHWVADVQSLTTEEQRIRIYNSIIGYWGDRNDYIFVSHRNPYKYQLDKTNRVQISAEEATDIFQINEHNRMNYSITALDQNTFLRLSATPSGILIQDKDFDLDTTVDPNFPPIFKRLPLGIRGIYNQQTHPTGTPIPVVGLEIRASQSVTEGINYLPPLAPDTEDLVDIEKLIQHSSKYPRGLLIDIDALVQRARGLGLEEQVLIDLLNVAKKESYKWKSELILGETFLPLNDWLSHPLVTRKLNTLPKIEGQNLIRRYNEALQNYINRVNKLSSARTHPYKSYQPDWTEKLEEFPDGYNRVYPRAQYPEVLNPLGLHSHPDLWFQIILFNEMLRFVAESDLENLLRF